MNLLNYIFVYQDARIKGVNKLILFKKCGGFDGYFYTFNEFGGLYSRSTGIYQNKLETYFLKINYFN